MTRIIRIGCAAGVAASALSVTVLSANPVLAHGYAGKRFFPATLTTDDPFVADELSLPTASWFRNGERPAEGETDVSAEFSKRLLDNLGISLAGTWTHLDRRDEANRSGFQNLETVIKYQFLTSAEHEAILSAGVGVEWGDTGSRQVGAEPQSTITPTLYFGKGAGDLPDDLALLKPFAVTGLVGYAVPTDSRHVKQSVDPETGLIDEEVDNRAQTLVYGFSLQYSLPYLQANIVDLGLPTVLTKLIPLVEFSFETPVRNRGGETTTAFVNPGVIWAGQSFQVGTEAVIPVNRDSGTGVGAIVQLHFFLDDLFPTTIGKPIF